ncbi:unnamed protein product [Jaminaea pallidilutea]
MADGADGDSAFQYVQSKSNGRRKARAKVAQRVAGDASSSKNPSQQENDSEHYVELIKAKRKLLQQNSVAEKVLECFDGLRSAIDAVPLSLLVLGLGRVTESRSAQIQAAFALELAAWLDSQTPEPETSASASRFISASTSALETASGKRLIRVTAFDPISSDLDDTVLRSLGIEPVDRATACPKAYEEPKLLFMPHCPRGLYEAYLRANWASAEQLRRVMLCCNRLTRYGEVISSAHSRHHSTSDGPSCIERVAPFLSWSPLPSAALGHGNSEALHDLGFQVFKMPPATAATEETTQAKGSVEGERQPLKTPEQDDADRSNTVTPHQKEDGMTIVGSRKKKNKKKPPMGTKGERRSSAYQRSLDPHKPEFWTLPAQEEAARDPEVL